MAVLWILGVVLSAMLLIVFFSNVYLELASRRARTRRLRATAQRGMLSRQETTLLELQEADACLGQRQF